MEVNQGQDEEVKKTKKNGVRFRRMNGGDRRRREKSEEGHGI